MPPILRGGATAVFTALLGIRALGGPSGPDTGALLGVTVLYAIATLTFTFGESRMRSIAAVLWVLTPIILLTSPSGRELSFSLTAPDSSAWRVHAIASLLWGGIAAAVALHSLVSRWPISVAGFTVLGAGALALAWASAPTSVGGNLTDEERVALPVIQLVNYGYEPSVLVVESGSEYTAVLDNPSSLPHTFTIESMEVDVYVPAGRSTIVSFTPEDDAEVICTVGDHADRGMRTLLSTS